MDEFITQINDFKNFENELPINSRYFVAEEIKKKRTIRIHKYGTDDFLPYPCYKSIIVYMFYEE
jgi:hypothetical protein